MDYIKIINDLNKELYESHGEINVDFRLETNGYCHAILFGSILLWNSEDDEREWIEEKNDYEPFIPFIKRMLNKQADDLMQLKFKLHPNGEYKPSF